MSKKKSNKISTLGSQMTSVISVSLVLLIVGLLASIGIISSNISEKTLSNVSIVVKLNDFATDGEAEELELYLKASPFTSELSFTSADEVLAQEMEFNAEILELLGENPYSSEFEIKLKSDYVHPDSVAYITNELLLNSTVDEVISQVDTIASIRSLSQKVSIALSALAIILLAISLVLIYNTVSIAVYARRFIIRTMQLVGATAGFIRKPFIIAGVWWGIISGIIASLLIFGGWYYLSTLNIEVSNLITITEIIIISVILLALGVAICSVAAFFATTRYLKASDDALYSE